MLSEASAAVEAIGRIVVVLLINEPFQLACPGGKAGSKARGKAIDNNTFLQLVGYCGVPLPDSRDDQGGGHDTT